MWLRSGYQIKKEKSILRVSRGRPEFDPRTTHAWQCAQASTCSVWQDQNYYYMLRKGFEKSFVWTLTPR